MYKRTHFNLKFQEILKNKKRSSQNDDEKRRRGKKKTSRTRIPE